MTLTRTGVFLIDRTGSRARARAYTYTHTQGVCTTRALLYPYANTHFDKRCMGTSVREHIGAYPSSLLLPVCVRSGFCYMHRAQLASMACISVGSWASDVSMFGPQNATWTTKRKIIENKHRTIDTPLINVHICTVCFPEC